MILEELKAQDEMNGPTPTKKAKYDSSLEENTGNSDDTQSQMSDGKKNKESENDKQNVESQSQISTSIKKPNSNNHNEGIVEIKLKDEKLQKKKDGEPQSNDQQSKVNKPPIKLTINDDALKMMKSIEDMLRAQTSPKKQQDNEAVKKLLKQQVKTMLGNYKATNTSPADGSKTSNNAGANSEQSSQARKRLHGASQQTNLSSSSTQNPQTIAQVNQIYSCHFFLPVSL